VALAEQDRTHITDLINLHGHLLDAGNLDRAGELFTPDVVYDVTDFGLGSVHGTAALREYLLALGEANPVGHHVTNIVITQIDERSARVRSKGLGVRADGTARSVVYDDIVTRQPGEAAVAHFTDTRIDLTYDEALDQARRFAPDLLVCEELDFVGPLVAAALGVPWAAHAITAPMPAGLYEAMLARADAQRTARGLRPRQRVALVDRCPTCFACHPTLRCQRTGSRRALRPTPGTVSQPWPPNFRSNGRWC
jgi:hypothetical protein